MQQGEDCIPREDCIARGTGLQCNRERTALQERIALQEGLVCNATGRDDGKGELQTPLQRIAVQEAEDCIIRENRFQF